MSETEFFGDAIERLEWDERKQDDTPIKRWHQVTRRTALTGGAAVLYDPAVGALQMTAIKTAAAPFGIELLMLEVNGPADMAASFEAAQRDGAQAIMALSSPIFGGNPERLAELTLTHRIPGLSLFPEFARAGGLIAYGPEIADLYRQVGGMVGKVLDGRPPADLPVERPARIRLAINLKTASTFGITIPVPLLARADEVIE